MSHPFTIYYLGGATQLERLYCWLVKGSDGVVYRIANRPHSWQYPLQYPRIAWEKPLPKDILSDVEAVVVGWQLGLPGYAEPNRNDWTRYGISVLNTKRQIEKEQKESWEETQRDGGLRCYDPTYGKKAKE